jgi:hypothetical protein
VVVGVPLTVAVRMLIADRAELTRWMSSFRCCPSGRVGDLLSGRCLVLKIAVGWLSKRVAIPGAAVFDKSGAGRRRLAWSSMMQTRHQASPGC